VPDPASAILVIKLGALGDFVLATGPFAAIRGHHFEARITLLTTAPFADLARDGGWFDSVWLDDRPRWTQPSRWLALRRRLLAGRFDRVYDLQTSDRSGWYFRLLPRARRPEWSGIVSGCSHPHANPARDFMHTIDRQAEQLAHAGIASVPAPDLSGLEADVSRLAPPPRFALLVPGGASHRPAKRWPAEHYAALARDLIADGITPVLLGAGEEAALLTEIAAAAPGAMALAGQTTLGDLAGLGRSAAFAIGNDTGPMHLLAAAGCRSVVLFSHDSDPALCAPRGPSVTILRQARLADLQIDAVRDVLGDGRGSG
jgi:ADP-heptose:LPS heptosyltransferase